MDKRRFGADLPRGFQQVQRADGIDVKVVKWPAGCEIVARLGGGVDDGLRGEFLEQGQHAGAVADVEFVMLEIFVHARSSRRWFQRVSPPGPKKSARMLLSTP